MEITNECVFDLELCLQQCLEEANEKNIFNAEKFFFDWFKNHGSSYYFLFKKNLKVTNIQFAELISILKSKTYCLDANIGINDIQFFSKQDFINAISGLVSEFTIKSKSDHGLDFIPKLYLDLFKRSVVIESFYGSCSVYLPPCLQIDLLSVCGCSGYIHSCGRAVYIDNTKHATEKRFFTTIKRYLKKFYTGIDKIQFCVYSHEDFTFYDRNNSNELGDGLDDVKMYIEKFYMGSEPLSNVIKNLIKEFENKLVVPQPGDFIKAQKEISKTTGIDKTHAIWLIVDRNIRNKELQPGDDRFFICYDQIVKNNNPLHYFNEEKPAWISSTTIPHDLAGALINITMPFWANGKTISLADPFVGTGTIFLESLKFENIEAFCSDNNPIVPILIEDNINLLSMNISSVSRIKNELEDILRIIKNPNIKKIKNKRKLRLINSHIEASELFIEIEKKSDGKSFTFSNQFIKKFIRLSFASRIIFYIHLRTYIRNYIGFFRNKMWVDAISKELNAFILNLSNFIKYKKRIVNSKDSKRIVLIESSFTNACTIKDDIYKKSRSLISDHISVKDARELSPSSYDIIITDPPYGYNTNDSIDDLAVLYKEMIPSIINSLKDDAQLVICLPEISYTGKSIPIFTNKTIITKQILAACDTLNRQVVNAGCLVPNPSVLFRAPYYWESKKALRRSILHFRITAK